MRLALFGVALAAGALYVSPRVPDEQGCALGAVVLAASACIMVGLGMAVAS